MKEIHVVGAAIFQGTELLCARRSQTMALPGKWEFPGGKLEPGESPEDALERELFEELGVRVDVGTHIARGSHSQPHARIILDVYACRLVAGTPTAHEHDLLKWCARADLSALDWAEADVPAVEAITRRWAEFSE